VPVEFGIEAKFCFLCQGSKVGLRFSLVSCNQHPSLCQQRKKHAHKVRGTAFRYPIQDIRDGDDIIWAVAGVFQTGGNLGDITNVKVEALGGGSKEFDFFLFLFLKIKRQSFVFINMVIRIVVMEKNSSLRD